MAHSTLKHEATIPLRTDMPNRLPRKPAGVREAPSALRSDRHATALEEPRRDRAGSLSATTEAVTALEAVAFAATMAAERACSLAAVLDAALAVLADAGGPHSAGPSSREPAPRVAGLSPREREVLALVVEGRTNKAIAEMLWVSPNTIKTHVASLLTKLQADSRAEMAAIAVRQGLG